MTEILESSMPNLATRSSRADPEVVASVRRRPFSASQKRALLAEADRCKALGTLGAFLRREHIYSSMLSSWRKQLGAARSQTPRPGRSSNSPATSSVCVVSSSARS